MIGVLAKTEQLGVVEEFFELFKTPWEFYRPDGRYDVVISTSGRVPESDAPLLLVFGASSSEIDARLRLKPAARHSGGTLAAGADTIPIYGELLKFADAGDGIALGTSNSQIVAVRGEFGGCTVLRFGYDLFDEVEHLLRSWQPVECAATPTLDIHVAMLRSWIVEAGIPVIEIPSVPSNRSFIACLTHDIDFVGIRRHVFDHSAFGFLYRATVASLGKLAQRRLSVKQVLKNWTAAASLPFVYLGWARDFWEPFGWYLEVERGLPATYFLIPFKRRAGEKVNRPGASRRATAYDVTDLPREVAALQQADCELGVHGIDSWHSAEKGRAELDRVAVATGASEIGVRMHWLMNDENTPAVLERAGYSYDSTCGYNETVGYRAGTSQVFRPLDASKLLELPLHIQDGALFYPQQLNLSEGEAEQRCQAMVSNAERHGGVLTLLWHDRSHAPERFWGGFYVRLLQKLKALDVWFASAAQVVAWFRKRRAVRFEQVDGSGEIRLRYDGEKVQPTFRVRVHKRNSQFSEIAWDGSASPELDQFLLTAARKRSRKSHAALSTAKN